MKRINLLLFLIPVLSLMACKVKNRERIEITASSYDDNKRLVSQTREGKYGPKELPYKETSFYDTTGRVIRQDLMIGNEKTIDKYDYSDTSAIWYRFLLDSSALHDTSFLTSNGQLIVYKEQHWSRDSALLTYEYLMTREDGKLSCKELRYNPHTKEYISTDSCRTARLF